MIRKILVLIFIFIFSNRLCGAELIIDDSIHSKIEKDYNLENYLTFEEEVYDLGDFIANLKIYHKFVEK